LRRWHPSCYTIAVPQKSKNVGKSLAANKAGGKKTSCIRLDDLMPRHTITGGNRLLFGASNNKPNQTNQPGAAS
jgi:hypothetical protein